MQFQQPASPVLGILYEEEYPSPCLQQDSETCECVICRDQLHKFPDDMAVCIPSLSSSRDCSNSLRNSSYQSDDRSRSLKSSASMSSQNYMTANEIQPSDDAPVKISQKPIAITLHLHIDLQNRSRDPDIKASQALQAALPVAQTTTQDSFHSPTNSLTFSVEEDKGNKPLAGRFYSAPERRVKLEGDEESSPPNEQEDDEHESDDLYAESDVVDTMSLAVTCNEGGSTEWDFSQIMIGRSRANSAVGSQESVAEEFPAADATLTTCDTRTEQATQTKVCQVSTPFPQAVDGLRFVEVNSVGPTPKVPPKRRRPCAARFSQCSNKGDEEDLGSPPVKAASWMPLSPPTPEMFNILSQTPTQMSAHNMQRHPAKLGLCDKVQHLWSDS